MHKFESYLFNEFTNAIGNLRHSPYAIGFHIWCVDDDLRKPAVSMLTNTYEHAKAHSPEGRKKRRGDASSALEALWNNSYWDWKTEVTVGNEYFTFEGDYHDKEGIVLRKKWVESLGLWYEDEYENSHFDEASEIGGEIIDHFDELCLKLARNLHSVIRVKLKTELPIIFFNRESPDDETITLTALANPRHLLDGYIAFIKNDCIEGSANFLEQDIDKSQLSYASVRKRYS